MAPRIVFLVMSAVARPGTVDQLAAALAPHTVLVHHDFSQTPDFALSAPNVVFVPDPVRTGWASFGFVDGIFHSLAYALGHLDFDYLQLLSPTCLPIKPLRRFEAHVSGPAEAHYDCVDVFGDRDALMSVGYRALTPEGTFRHRVARRLSNEYYAGASGVREEAGIWLRTGGGTSAVARLAYLATRALTVPAIGRHIFDASLRPRFGSTWFGARRHVVAGMVELFRRPGLRDYFSRLRIADEFLVPTLLDHLGPRKGPLNHLIKTFDQARPGEWTESDLPVLAASGAWFARKFPDDPDAPVRLKLLSILTGPERDATVAAQPSSHGGRYACQAERP